MAKQRGRWERVRMKCVIKAAVITGENPRFSPISATGYNLSVLRRRLVGSVSQTQEEICSEEHASSILRQSSNPVCAKQGPNNTEPNLYHHGETTYNVG